MQQQYDYLSTGGIDHKQEEEPSVAVEGEVWMKPVTTYDTSSFTDISPLQNSFSFDNISNYAVCYNADYGLIIFYVDDSPKHLRAIDKNGVERWRTYDIGNRSAYDAVTQGEYVAVSSRDDQGGSDDDYLLSVYSVENGDKVAERNLGSNELYKLDISNTVVVGVEDNENYYRGILFDDNFTEFNISSPDIPSYGSSGGYEFGPLCTDEYVYLYFDSDDDGLYVASVDRIESQTYYETRFNMSNYHNLEIIGNNVIETSTTNPDTYNINTREVNNVNINPSDVDSNYGNIARVESIGEYLFTSEDNNDTIIVWDKEFNSVLDKQINNFNSGSEISVSGDSFIHSRNDTIYVHDLIGVEESTAAELYVFSGSNWIKV